MSHLITLRHATPRANLPSIARIGLDPALHRCTRREVWLHASCKTAWAILHTSHRHLTPTPDIAIVTVRVPRDWLTRRRRCVWTVRQLIPPDRIVSVNPRASLCVSVS